MRENIIINYDTGFVEIQVDNVVEQDGNRIKLSIEYSNEAYVVSINNSSIRVLAHAILYLANKYGTK